MKHFKKLELFPAGLLSWIKEVRSNFDNYIVSYLYSRHTVRFVKKSFYRAWGPTLWINKRLKKKFSPLLGLVDKASSEKFQSILRSFYLREYRFLKESLHSIEHITQIFESMQYFKLNRLIAFLLSYNSLFFQIAYEKILDFREISCSNKTTLFILKISFKKQKIFFLLQDAQYFNVVSFASGLPIKFFGKKKALRKTKFVKLFLAKYLRKLIVISKLQRIHLMVKGAPIFLNEILLTLNQRIDHKFINPIDNQTIDEISPFSPFVYVTFSYFTFYNNKAFVIVRGKKKGRIKRKLLRKLVASNRIVD